LRRAAGIGSRSARPETRFKRQSLWDLRLAVEKKTRLGMRKPGALIGFKCSGLTKN
jgi:hypothetical protein